MILYYLFSIYPNFIVHIYNLYELQITINLQLSFVILRLTCCFLPNCGHQYLIYKEFIQSE